MTRVPSLDTFARDGFVVLPGFADAATATGMLDAVIDLARAHGRGESIAPAFVLPEANLADRAVVHAEDAASKIFGIHRREPFRSFVTEPRLVRLVVTLLGTDRLSCFLSQFIFKNPGAWGQPCHQDSYYFPFEPMRPVVGAWLATTEADLENGCLWVVPGSQLEPVHEHVPDRRPGANYGYYEIVDHDLSGAVPVELRAGDLLLFDSFLMHFSTDNVSARRRGAMVCHYAASATVDATIERRGYTINDWMPIDPPTTER
jgi:ectoine hydroxylase-related dioxygenase (phytanoyl-CoA dioxygenase family)